jgi:hypothetical protein
MTRALGAKEILRSGDRVTSPVAFSRDGDRYLVSLSMSPEAFEKLEELAEAPGKSWDEVISKALALYMEAVEATRTGKAVGIAPAADVLETQFIGF